MIVKALERSGQGLTVEDVLERIRSGRARYWSAPDAEFVVEIDGPEVRVWLGAGQREALFRLYEAEVEPWARSIGAKEVVVDGRKGWLRFAARYGFENVSGNLLRKVL